MSVIPVALRFERNEPPIDQVYIHVCGVEPRLILDGRERFYFDVDDFNNVAAWRKLGRAIKDNSTIRHLEIGESAIQVSEPRDTIERDEVSAAECYEAFCNDLKNNKSIEQLTIFNIDLALQIFDLGYFLQNNTNLKHLILVSRRQLLPEQGNIIASALAGVQLPSLTLGGLEFGDGVFEQIMSACLGVEMLVVYCETDAQFTTLAALLRNPNARLQDLTLISEFVSPEQGNIIATGLVGVKLRTLNMERLTFEDNGGFEQIMSACLGVEKLEVDCETNSQYTAFAELLRNPLSMLQYLTLGSTRPVSPEQGNIIATGLDGVKLKTLNMAGFQDLEFRDGTLEQIVSACVRVEALYVNCSTNSHYTALAELLRNPLSMLQILKATDINDEDIDADMVAGEISESLVGNTKLRELSLDVLEYEDKREVDFDMLLCNSTTLQNICNSNHMLEHVNHSCTSFTSECLELNRNENKNVVIQNKVMQSFFVGSFDLAPFASMPLSVLAKVMSVGQAMRNKQTAIFELLRGIPELCNVPSGRK
jgi:hypothetical protein